MSVFPDGISSGIGKRSTVGGPPLISEGLNRTKRGIRGNSSCPTAELGHQLFPPSYRLEPEPSAFTGSGACWLLDGNLDLVLSPSDSHGDDSISSSGRPAGQLQTLGLISLITVGANSLMIHMFAHVLLGLSVLLKTVTHPLSSFRSRVVFP